MVAPARHSVDVKPLTTLDYVFSVTDTIGAPQDFALIFHFAQGPPLDGLQLGAQSAKRHFPTSGARIERGHWVPSDDNADIQMSIVSNELGARHATENFINQPFSLRAHHPVRQLLIRSTDHATLVTRFHHAATDGLGAALWLAHQLNVAVGLKEPENLPCAFTNLPLRSAETSARRSRFAYAEACDPLWSAPSKRSGIRHWQTFGFTSSQLRRACRDSGGFSFNDLLATCTLEVFRDWNRQKRPTGQQRIGLWLPMNVRQHSNQGFGNGTSRIRLYARYSPDASLIDKAREVRTQVSWSTKHGEWVVPEVSSLRALPRWAASRILHGFLSLPSVDMTTGVFSHADSGIGESREAFQHIERVECVGLMHPRQRIALNGTTHNGCTWLTFTYDSGLFTSDDVRQLSQIYERQLKLASSELLCAEPLMIYCEH